MPDDQRVAHNPAGLRGFRLRRAFTGPILDDPSSARPATVQTNKPANNPYSA